MTEIRGQMVLPTLMETVGFESIVLRPRHERFCWYYVLSGDDAGEAYRKAYPRASRRTARVNASKLLTNTAINRRIQEIRAELRRRHEVTADNILHYHSLVLNQDPREYFDANCLPLPVPEMSAKSAVILDLATHVGKNGTMYIPRFPSKFQSAQEMAKILGLYKEPSMNTSTPAIMLKFMSTSLSDRAESLALQQVVEQEQNGLRKNDG